MLFIFFNSYILLCVIFVILLFFIHEINDLASLGPVRPGELDEITARALMEHARLAPEAEATVARALQSHMEGLQAPSEVEVGFQKALFSCFASDNMLLRR